MAKKLSALFLSLCIMCTMLVGISISANAANSGRTGDCTWILSDDGTILTISGSGAMGNYSYTSRPPWGERITSVIINDGVKTIGDCAFYFCFNLISIKIPSSVESIGNYVLTNSGELTSIKVDANNKNYCSVDDVLFNKSKTTILRFSGGKSDTSYVIPDSVEAIGNDAFYYCSNLVSVTAPDKVKSIGEFAFYGCTGLVNFKIPNNVKSIGRQAFASCESLVNIEIPYGVETIGEYAFGGCTGIKNIVIPDSVRSIGEGVFIGCSSLISVTISNNVENISDHAFDNCPNLKNIVFGKNVKNIGEYAFSDAAIVNITLPDSVTNIGTYAFIHCHDLTSITLPEGLKVIGPWAFKNCNSITRITIPKSVKSLNTNAFDGCSNLSVIDYKGSQQQWNIILVRVSQDPFSSIKILYGSTEIDPDTQLEVALPPQYKDDSSSNINVQGNTNTESNIVSGIQSDKQNTGSDTKDNIVDSDIVSDIQSNEQYTSSEIKDNTVNGDNEKPTFPWTIILIVLAVLAAAGGVTFGVLFILKKKKESL